MGRRTEAAPRRGAPHRRRRPRARRANTGERGSAEIHRVQSDASGRARHVPAVESSSSRSPAGRHPLDSTRRRPLYDRVKSCTRRPGSAGVPPAMAAGPRLFKRAGCPRSRERRHMPRRSRRSLARHRPERGCGECLEHRFAAGRRAGRERRRGPKSPVLPRSRALVGPRRRVPPPCTGSTRYARGTSRTACGSAGAKSSTSGCGGGLLSESLAARGADVLGIDASEEARAAARAHLEASGLDVEYRATTAEALAQSLPDASTWSRAWS